MLTQESALRKDKRTAQHGPALEHRHFAFIAATLKASKPAPTDKWEIEQWGWYVRHFADACAATNPRFDRARFLKACGAAE